MDKERCGKEAVSNVGWANGNITQMCERHEAQARALCQAMGWPMTIIMITDKDKKCESVVREK